MAETGGEQPGGQPEPPDSPADGNGMEHADSEAFHFAETDPSHRFGRFDQVLGRGAFKVVYKAFDTQEGTEVAWNQVRVSELMSAKDAENKEERDRLFAEIRVLKALKHKNIMSFYDSWYDPRTYTVNFITELFTSGTLRQYRKRHKHIDEEVLKRWAYQILCGLVYLHGHSPPIIHRDLKCDNIFINGSDGVVKIGDLGLATMLRSRTAPQSVLGTPEFMAPELYEEEYDDRVDVYSFGMCLLELSTMEYPYSECKNAAQIYRKVSLGVRPAGLQKVGSQELAEFINVCISAREARPRARQLLKHPYFDSIRRDKALAASRSDAALVAAGGGGDGASEYGSVTSGPVSRTASSLADMLGSGGGSFGHPTSARGEGSGLAPLAAPAAPAAAGGPHPGPPSASGSSTVLPLSRTLSAEAAHSDHAPSDAASVRSQRSNASELALAVLENIAEEAEAADNGEDEVAAVAAAAAAAAMGASPLGPASRQGSQASRGGTPLGSPSAAPGSPAKPSSPGGSSEERCCAATDRRFAVKGDWLEVDKRVQLRLRICEPSGSSRTVEFEFDLAVDTATAVAAEMVSDLELTPDDAAVIAAAISGELARLSALPETNPHASMSLAKAARVFERQLTVNALEQAHSSNGGLAAALDEPFPGSPGGASPTARQHGRFAELAEEVLSPGAAAAAAAAAQAHAQQAAPPPLPPSVAAAAAVPRPPSFEVLNTSRRTSIDSQPERAPLKRSGGSTGSLVSLSSASSIPTSVASQPDHGFALPAPPQQQQHAAAGGHPLAATVPSVGLARPSPPPRPASTPANVPSMVAAAAAAAAAVPPPGGLARPSPPPRPMSPLATAAAPQADMPSPSQRVVRSNSVDAMSLLSRTSSMPAGREAPSPLGAGSGALSPSGSGILSPSASVHEKRIPLNQLFANLEDLKASRADTASPGLEAAMAAAAAASLPPLPHPAGGRPLPPSSSGSLLEAATGSADLAGAATGLLRPRSEACLASLPMPARGGGGGVAPTALSAPTGAGALAAAVALADAGYPAVLASPSSASSSAVSPRSATSQMAAASAAAADAIQRLDLQSSVPVPGAAGAAAPAAAARRGAAVLSAPPSKLPSRDASPVREGSLSPTRMPAPAAGHGDAAGQQVNGKRPPVKDKEALRRQAADAMKAVELRSLNLLEGGLLGGKGKGDARGVPMAAGKQGSMGNLVAAAQAAAAAAVGAGGAPPKQPAGMAAGMRTVLPPSAVPQAQQPLAQQQQPQQPMVALGHPPPPKQQLPAAAVPPPQPAVVAVPPLQPPVAMQPQQPQANGVPAAAPAPTPAAAAPQPPQPTIPKLAPPPLVPPPSTAS